MPPEVTRQYFKNTWAKYFHYQYQTNLNLIVLLLKQWFLTRGYTSQEGVNEFLRERELLHALQHQSLINNFTNKYICLYNLFHVRRLETKDDNDFEGSVE